VPGGNSAGRLVASNFYVRVALIEVRFDAIDAIGQAARVHDAGHVLVAGDVFDTEGPEDRTIVQALARMDRYPCRWWLLLGNHDYARNGGLWDQVRARRTANVIILIERDPQEMEDGVWLLPAPLTHRHNLDDPTADFDTMATPEARLRIGLAHGSIKDFGSRSEVNNQISPDRAERSDLNYLALDDWHGVLEIGSRTWYAGMPETDRFQRDVPGHVFLVDFGGGKRPQVPPIRTGRYQWLIGERRVNDTASFDAELQHLMREVDPAATLLQLSLVGITSTTDCVAILGRIEHDLRTGSAISIPARTI
jgi:DNA repair exonuclease SbcCD nuclease subunit